MAAKADATADVPDPRSATDTGPEASAKPPPTGPPPAHFGAYEVTAELGRGGMGVVYRAVHRSLKRECAVKTTGRKVQDERALERFVLEGQAVARLGKHAHIAQVYDAGVSGGIPYIAMELVSGESLGDRLRRAGKLPERETVEIGYKVALALDHAHRHGIVHRDVKPGNVILGDDGEPQLLDFGIARDLTASADDDAGIAVGTPSYMAPEQADPRRGPVDARSDVYALGATLYALGTGRTAFQAASVSDLLFQVVTEEPPSPMAFAEVSCDFAAIILKALEKDPAARYQTALEMADDLSRLSAGVPPRARNLGPIGRLLRRARRHPRALAAIVGFAATVVLMGAYFAVTTGKFEALWADVVRRTARTTAREVRSRFQPAVPVLEEYRGLAEAGLLPVDDQELLGQYLARRLRHGPPFDWISYGDERGKFTGAVRRDGEVIVNRSWRDAAGVGHLREVRDDAAETPVRTSDDWAYDPRERPWYRLALESDGVAWTPPYEWASGQGSGITATLALRDGGRPVGAFTADYHLGSLSEFLAGLDLGPRGRAYLLARDGGLLAGPERSLMAPDPLLRAALGSMPGAVSALGEDEPTPFRFEHDGESWMAAAQAVKPAEGLLVALVVIVPEDEVTGDVRRQRTRAALAGIALALGAALSWIGLATRRRRRLRAAIHDMRVSGAWRP